MASSAENQGWSAQNRRSVLFLIIGLMLGGCAQETLEPASQAGWSAHDKILMAQLPYAQADIPEQYRRHIVDYEFVRFPQGEAQQNGAARAANVLLCTHAPSRGHDCAGRPWQKSPPCRVSGRHARIVLGKRGKQRQADLVEP